MIPLTAMTAVWTVLVPLEEKVPDPNDVKPGWLGFVMFLLLLAAVVFLAFSFRKQLRKVSFEEPGKGTAGDAAGAGPDGAHDGAGSNGETGPRTP
jgi:hypothetical protein